MQESRASAACSALAIVCGLSVAAAWFEAFFHFPQVGLAVDAWLAALEGSLGFWFGLTAALALAAAELLLPGRVLSLLGTRAAQRATAVGLAWAVLPYLLRWLEPRVPASTLVALGIALLILVAARFLPAAGRGPSAVIALVGVLLVHLLSPFAVIQVESAAPELPQRDEIPPAAADAPCVLLIVADTLRDDRVGAVRDGRPVMPFLDRLAAEGTRSSIASTSNQTGPAHASLLTGTHILRNGIYANGWTIPPDLPSLAELLHDAGWRTGAVTSNPVIRSEGGYGRGFECYGDVTRFNSPVSMAFHGVRRSSSRWRLMLDFTEIASAWLRHVEWRIHLMPLWLQPRADDTLRRCQSLLGEMAEGGQPWFLFAHFMDPHGPYDPPPQTLGTWSTPTQIRGLPRASHAEFLIRHDAMEHRVGDPAVERAAQAYAVLYDEEILFLDSNLELLVAEARRAAGKRPLWIVFTADHGEHFFEHGLLGHSNSLYEELVRVPLITQGLPSAASIPTRIEDLPRMLASQLLGARAGALLGEGSPQLAPNHSLQIWGRHASLRTERWKLFASATAFRGEYQAVELWDLDAAAGEHQDVAAQHPEVVAQLLAALQASVAGSVLAPRPSGEDVMDDRTQRRLAELGYAH